MGFKINYISAVWIYDAFENNFGIDHEVSKFLNSAFFGHGWVKESMKGTRYFTRSRHGF